MHRQAGSRKEVQIEAAGDGAAGTPAIQRLERTQQLNCCGRNHHAGKGRWQAVDVGERRSMSARTRAVLPKGPPRGLNHPPKETTMTTQIGREQHRSSYEASPETRSSLQEGRARALAPMASSTTQTRARTSSFNKLDKLLSLKYALLLIPVLTN